MIGRLLADLSRLVYARYIIASAGALAVDLGLFMALLGLGVPATSAAAAGYAAGIVAHWLFSSRAVFADRVSAEAPHRQKLLFLASAFVGLALTALVVGLGERMGLDPLVAKLCAIAVSFHATYFLRKAVVFA